MNNLDILKVGFFGTPKFAVQILESLKKNKIKIEYVVSQPPKPAGRGKKENLSDVNLWGIKNDVKIFTPKNSNDEKFLKILDSIKVDFLIVVAYGKIINEHIINIPKYFCLNVHASILPRWRGAAPIQRSILEGDKSTGITIMKVEKKLDAGPIILNKKIAIENTDNSGSLTQKLSILGSKLLFKSMKMILKNEYKLQIQNENEVTYAKKIKKEETKIDWSKRIVYIERSIRAYNPWPGAWTEMKLKEKFRIKIHEAEIVSSKDSSFDDKKIGFCSKSLIIKCKDGLLKIKKLQKQGKKIMNAKDFINGFKIEESYLE